MPAFFYHYNKPRSLQLGRPTITLHYRGQCLLVHDLVVNVPTKARFRKTQPRFVMAGTAKSINITQYGERAEVN